MPVLEKKKRSAVHDTISCMTSKYAQLRNHNAHFHSFLVLHAVSRTISFSTEQVE